MTVRVGAGLFMETSNQQILTQTLTRVHRNSGFLRTSVNDSVSQVLSLSHLDVWSGRIVFSCNLVLNFQAGLSANIVLAYKRPMLTCHPAACRCRNL